jgi:hypothetical protein
LLASAAPAAFASDTQESSRPGSAVVAEEQHARSRVRIPREIPVRRDPEDVGAGAGVGGVVLLVVLLAASGFALVHIRRSMAAPRATRAWRSGWFRWFAASRAAGGVRLVQSVRLTPRASVHVVRWDDKEWLIGCADDSVQILGCRAEAAEPSPPAARAEPAPAAPELAEQEKSR